MRKLLIVGLLVVVWTAQRPAGQTPLDAGNRALSRELLQELIEIPTTEADGATPRAAQALAERLIAAGFPAEDVHVLRQTPKLGHLVARLRGRDSSARPLLLMAHIDVVPALREDWSVDPWKLLERDGWFYGRGTSDNKAGAATLVANLIRLKKEGWQPRRDVIISLTGDEETAQEGMQWLLADHRALIDAGMAINTDAGSVILKNGKPSMFTVQASEKVYSDYQFEVTDVGGHSSLAKPDNPIYTLAEALQRLAAYRFPLNVTEVAREFFRRSARAETGPLAADMLAVARMPADPAAAGRLSKSPFYNARLRTTCVATKIQGGHADNALPQLARANINCRMLPGESPATIEATVRCLAGPRVKVTVSAAPVTSPPSPVPADLLKRIEALAAPQWPGAPVVPVMEAGATDGMFTRKAGIPTYGIGALPEDPDDVRAHGKDERVSVEGYYDAVEFWYRMIKAFGD